MPQFGTANRAKLLRLEDILAPDRNSFGAVRLSMALAVLISHCFYLLSSTSHSEPLHAWTGYTLGEYGVQVFFIVSGILVAPSLDRSRSVLDFAIGRSLRIFPALVVCVLLTALVLGPIMTACAPLGYLADAGVPRYIARTLLLTTGSAPLPGVFEDLPVARLVNLSLWTL